MFFTILPLIPGLASQYGYRETKTKNNNHQILTATESSKSRKSTSPAAGATVGSLGIVPSSGEMFSQDLSTLLEQPAVVQGNKGETVVEHKGPPKHCSHASPLESPRQLRLCGKPSEKNIRPQPR